MRRGTFYTIFAIILATPTCGFAQGRRAEKSDLIVSLEPFSPNATIKTGHSPLLGPDSKVEEGEINGVNYIFYYSDGSGSFVGTKGGTLHGTGNYAASTALRENWSVGCKKDAISDKKTCHMTMVGKNLWIWAYPNGIYNVSVGNGDDHFPGSTVAIRIDGGTPITATAKNGGSFSRQVSATLIAQIKRASKLTTRYMEWPNRYWVDETWELYGFNEALQYITWAVNKIR